MTTRSHTVDRELFLILVALLLLAFATRFVDASDNSVGTTLVAAGAASSAAVTAPATAVGSASIALDAANNPYWAPAHAFARRLAPVYSDAVAATEAHAPRE